ncbi:MAG: hypothetical protein K2Q10_09295, partial [Rhodospirillales bacterium]|nr:hypothetical protein [Rhodospirillales bacterium]
MRRGYLPTALVIALAWSAPADAQVKMGGAKPSVEVDLSVLDQLGRPPTLPEMLLNDKQGNDGGILLKAPGTMPAPAASGARTPVTQPKPLAPLPVAKAAPSVPLQSRIEPPKAPKVESPPPAKVVAAPPPPAVKPEAKAVAAKVAKTPPPPKVQAQVQPPPKAKPEKLAKVPAPP